MLTLIILIVLGGMALAIWKWVYTVSVWDDYDVVDDLEDAANYAVEEAEILGNAAASIVVDAVQRYEYGSQPVEVVETEDLVDDSSEITQDDDSDVSDDE